MIKSVYRFAWAVGALLFVGPVLGQNQQAVDQPQGLDNIVVAKSASSQEPANPSPTSLAAQLGYWAGEVTNFKATPASTTTTFGENTYTALVSSNSSRVPFSTADRDNNNSATIPIGFPFKFRGKIYDFVILNTNGFIKLGSMPPSRPNLFFPSAQTYSNDAALYSTVAADSNILAPFNVDLVTAATAPAADFRYSIVTLGGWQRVFTVQWSNVRDKLGGQLARISFQVKLYEGTNFIDFAYGYWVASQAPESSAGAVIGIKGVKDQYIFGSHGSSSTWGVLGPVWLIKNRNFVGVNQFNYNKTFLPELGQTFRFKTPNPPKPPDPRSPFRTGSDTGSGGTVNADDAASTDFGGDSPKLNYNVVPNPAGAQGFRVEGLTSPSPAVLTDALGRQRRFVLTPEDGYRIQAHLPPGVYMLHVADQRLRVVVE